MNAYHYDPSNDPPDEEEMVQLLIWSGMGPPPPDNCRCAVPSDLVYKENHRGCRFCNTLTVIAILFVVAYVIGVAYVIFWR